MKSLMAAVVTVGILFSAPAWAQMESREGIALQNQILELRRDVQALRSDQGRSQPSQSSGSSLGYGQRPPAGGNGSSEITTQLLERVDRLEDSIRQLNGRIDELDNARTRQGADLAKQIADLQFRLDNAGAAPATATPAPGRPTPPPLTPSQAPTPLGTLPLVPPPPARRTPELALQDGNAALARRDYAGAEAGAREVLASGKTAPRAYDAQFLLAQAMMGQRNYPQAAVAYGDTYDRAKTGTHAQDSLLGLATSLTAINEKRSACAALDTLHQQFPNERPDIQARSAPLRVSAGCR